MRFIRYASIAVFAIALIVVAMANRQTTTLRILPEEMDGMAAINPVFENIPVFVILFGGILAGLIIGFIWEWIREAGERAAAARQAREMRNLRAEIKRLKGEKHEGKDEVLAILDEVG